MQEGAAQTPPRPTFVGPPATPTDPKATKAKKHSSSSRGTPLPDDWQPKTEHLERLRRERKIDASKRVELFKSFWLANAGAP